MVIFRGRMCPGEQNVAHWGEDAGVCARSPGVELLQRDRRLAGDMTVHTNETTSSLLQLLLLLLIMMMMIIMMIECAW